MVRMFLFFCLITIYSCNNSSSNNETVTNRDSSLKTTPSPQTKPATTNETLSPQLDSIDKANNNTIDLAKDNINKATVSREDSLLSVSSSKFLDHRFFGYAHPDVHSKRMILFSNFTNDIEGNPFNCPFGAYYSTNSMDNVELKYKFKEGAFFTFALLKNKTPQDTIYIEQKWIDFEK